MIRTPDRPAWPRGVAVGFCLLLFLLITGDAVRHPLKHTTMPTYRLASTQWWAGQDPYTLNNHAGFLYFPQAAVVFTPFAWGPAFVGDILWRLLTFGLFLYALVRLHRFFLAPPGTSPGRMLLALVLLAVPSSMASLRNAQFDLPLAALLVLSAAEVAEARWNAAMVWLCLALALKPLAVVPMLLFGALYRTLIPRLVVGLLLLVALPFLNFHPAFVAHEYVRCAQTLLWAAQPNEPRYSDLGALLSHIGVYPPTELMTAVRVLFALLFLGLGFAAVQRLDRPRAAWTIGGLSAAYLMLFNPRTETCSYVFLGPFVAALAVLYYRRDGLRWLGCLLGFAALGFACDAVPGLHNLTDRWLKPLLAVLFLPVVVSFIFRADAGHRPLEVVDARRKSVAA